jgi:hypothetical protein
MYQGELSEPVPPTKCCNARAIWDECEKHWTEKGSGCYATSCEQCGVQIETDCEDNVYYLSELISSAKKLVELTGGKDNG